MESIMFVHGQRLFNFKKDKLFGLSKDTMDKKTVLMNAIGEDITSWTKSNRLGFLDNVTFIKLHSIILFLIMMMLGTINAQGTGTPDCDIRDTFSKCTAFPYECKVRYCKTPDVDYCGCINVDTSEDAISGALIFHDNQEPCMTYLSVDGRIDLIINITKDRTYIMQNNTESRCVVPTGIDNTLTLTMFNVRSVNDDGLICYMYLIDTLVNPYTNTKVKVLEQTQDSSFTYQNPAKCAGQVTMWPWHPKSRKPSWLWTPIFVMRNIINRNGNTVSLSYAFTITTFHDNWTPEQRITDDCNLVEEEGKDPIRIYKDDDHKVLFGASFSIYTYSLNMSEWDITRTFPQCQEYTVGIQQDFYYWLKQDTTFSRPVNTRRKREWYNTVLGGLGVGASMINGVNIESLAARMSTLAAAGSKSQDASLLLSKIQMQTVINNYRTDISIIKNLINKKYNISVGMEKIASDTSLALGCIALQMDINTNAKIFLQALFNHQWPYEVPLEVPKISFYYRAFWHTQWLGCLEDTIENCAFAIFLPTRGVNYNRFKYIDLGKIVNSKWIKMDNKQNDKILVGVKTVEYMLNTENCLLNDGDYVCPYGVNVLEEVSWCWENNDTCQMKLNKIPIQPAWTYNKGMICWHQIEGKTEIHEKNCSETVSLAPGSYCTKRPALSVTTKDIRGKYYDIIPPILKRTDSIMKYDQRTLYNVNIGYGVDFYKQLKNNEELLQVIDKAATGVHNTLVQIHTVQGMIKSIKHDYIEETTSWWQRWFGGQKTGLVMGMTHFITHPLVILIIIIMVLFFFSWYMFKRINRLRSQLMDVEYRCKFLTTKLKFYKEME
ncbi:Hypothetical predicted protein [Pelobates cultripes]|uniref:Uncharacterized protein n=1 Tax=Pelobates cultripes TaxID=61616 RepID=A0AAD1TM53_PELCU|nr:Hypothetical predicted protein [Pelobates cultripes]